MREQKIFKISTVWKWLKQNHKGVLLFFAILAMGTGIAPTIGAGQRFAETLQFEKMAEASPAYAVVSDVEAQTQFYVLSVEGWVDEGLTVVWVLPLGVNNELVVGNNLHAELYTIFASLAKNYSEAANYLIIVAEPATVPTMTGFVTALRGTGYFSMSAAGAGQLVGAGIENADASLEALYGSEFDIQSLQLESIYMTNLLPRAPGHIAPWEKEG